MRINEALGNVTRVPLRGHRERLGSRREDGGGPQRFRCPPGPHGQQHWHETHPECGGRAQSPIDIATSRAQHDPSLPPLRPEGYERPESPQLTLANNGHTAVLTLPPSLRLRGLPRTFAAVQLHFHWGRPGSAAGAEHLLDGRRAPAELGDNPHPAYDNILKHLGSIRHAGQTVAIPAFSIRELLPEQLERYYRYNGSLTTPPCSQSVLWNLLPQPVRISRAQLEQLQGSLYSTKEQEEPQPLVNNFRAPQELNQRSVLSSFARGPQGYSTGGIIGIIFGIIACCAGLFLAVRFGAKRMRERREQAQDVAFKSSPRSSPTPAEP
ncbi:carbonic anhydrase 14 isoform X5 [Zonotrichia leucophrys gambelii]|uniref:carbonic anhydrase 14 isoform X5 n=1 Tax=Zonotrichia leucophrys gambelii TaxID=257770 RepID=UPI00313FF713